jgi:hypothetical protein
LQSTFVFLEMQHWLAFSPTRQLAIDDACASLPVVLTALNHAVEILGNEIGVA